MTLPDNKATGQQTEATAEVPKPDRTLCPNCDCEGDEICVPLPSPVEEGGADDDVYAAVYAELDKCGGTMGSTVLHFLAGLSERGFQVSPVALPEKGNGECPEQWHENDIADKAATAAGVAAADLVTDAMVEAGAKAMFGKYPLTSTRLAHTLARDCLRAALEAEIARLHANRSNEETEQDVVEQEDREPDGHGQVGPTKQQIWLHRQRFHIDQETMVPHPCTDPQGCPTAYRHPSDPNGTARQEAIADPNPDKSTCVKTGRDNRTPENLCAVLSSEGEVEALARKWEADADVLESLAPKGTWVNGAATARREDADELRAAFRSVSSGKGEEKQDEAGLPPLGADGLGR